MAAAKANRPAPRRRTTAAPGFGRRAAASASAVFRWITRTGLANILRARTGASQGDVEAIHQMRIAITRLRANFAFFSPTLAERDWSDLKNEVRWLNRLLGRVRDIDVTVEMMRSTAPGQDRAIGRRLQKRRELAMRQLREGLASTRFRQLAGALDRWTESGRVNADDDHASGCGVADELNAFCRTRMRRWLKRLKKRGRLLETMEGRERHRLRIKAKRGRYMLQALADRLSNQHPKRYRKIQKALKALHQHLGEWRDLERLGRALPENQRLETEAAISSVLRRAANARDRFDSLKLP